MANELKLGNKVVFLNGNPILLPVRAADPGSGTAGDMYWNNTLLRVRTYNGTIWESLATGTVVTDHGALTGLSDDDHSQYALLAGRTGGQTITGGNAASNNLILRSTTNGTKGQVRVDETTASTSSTTGAFTVAGGVGISGALHVAGDAHALNFKGLYFGGEWNVNFSSNENGIVNLLANGNGTGNILTGTGNKTVNIANGAGSNVINIGGANSTVNINGTLQWVNTTNLNVSDKLITVNKGGAASSGDDAGLEIEENNTITGWFKTGDTRSAWLFKAPAKDGEIELLNPDFDAVMDFSGITGARTYTLPDESGTIALASSLGNYVQKAGDTMTGFLTMNGASIILRGAEAAFRTSDEATTVTLGLHDTPIDDYSVHFPASMPSNDTFLKYSGGEYVWGTAGQGSVTSGLAGRLGIYPTSDDNIADTYVQNAQNITVGIEAQASRSAALTYVIPNPGNAIASANFVLTEGSQILNGVKTFSSDILVAGNMVQDIGTDGNEVNNIWVRRLSHNDAADPDLTIETIGNNGDIVMAAHGTGRLNLVDDTQIWRQGAGAGLDDSFYGAIELAANITTATEIDPQLSFSASTYSGAVLNYSIKEATTNKCRVGQLYVSTDGTTANYADQFCETDTVGSVNGLQLEANLSSGNVIITFKETDATNGCSMKVHVRKFT